MIDNRTAPFGAFILRQALGIMFIAHAGLKFFVFTPEGTAGFFESIGLPGVLGYVTMLVEAAAGVALITGIFTRAVSLAMVPVLIGTIVFVHGANGWVFGNEGGGWEYSAFLIAASFAQALIGPGAFAIGSARGKASTLESAKA